MGQHQHDMDELACMERICLALAEQTRVPARAGALRELAENHGLKVAKRTVIRIVDCFRRRRKRRAIRAVDRIPLPPHWLSTQPVGRISHGTQSPSRLRSKRRQLHDLNVRWGRGVNVSLIGSNRTPIAEASANLPMIDWTESSNFPIRRRRRVHDVCTDRSRKI